MLRFRNICACDSKITFKVLSSVIGIAVLILIPYLHIGIGHLKIWVPNKPAVNREKCICNCFDTVFKGTYEKPGQTGYKHVYFNATWQTFHIWIVVVIFFAFSYESIKYLLLLANRRAFRRSMLALFLINIYPHYYAMWSFFSYYNDDFYKYFNHQMFFCITEIISTFIVLHMCNIDNDVTSGKALLVSGISIIHVLLSGMDQFVLNVFFNDGAMYQKLRDIGLMIPDSMHVILPLWELHRKARMERTKLYKLFTKRDVIGCTILVTMGTMIGKLL